MKYPRRSPYLICKRTGRDEYMMEHYLYSEKYLMDHKTVSFLKQLDGKHNPYDLLSDSSRQQVGRMLKELKACDLLAPKKTLLKLGVGSCIYPLIYCYPNKLQKWFAKFWNTFLMIMYIPMLITGVVLQSRGTHTYMRCKDELYLAMFIGVLFGITFHELSHACAGIAYNGHLFEIGIGTQYFLPMGYVLIDNSSVESRMKRIQIDAAGIEMNLFLYGVFMCMSAAGFWNPFVMKLSGTINLAMAILNALPLSNFDGMKILAIITGKKDVLEHAKKLIRHRKRYLRKPACRARCIAALTASYGLVGFQLLLPMLLIYEGISLVRLILL